MLILARVRQAAVHGFSKEDLVSISENLNYPTILSRACALVSPSSEETVVKQAWKFFDSWVERSCADPLLGCRPKGSVSRLLVLSDDEFLDADSCPSTASSCTWILERGFGFDQRKTKLSNHSESGMCIGLSFF
jgi:hypothetical protein